jgi:hypothetical protein
MADISTFQIIFERTGRCRVENWMDITFFGREGRDGRGGNGRGQFMECSEKIVFMGRL